MEREEGKRKMRGGKKKMRGGKRKMRERKEEDRGWNGRRVIFDSK